MAIWENIKFFVSGHRAISIVTAGAVGVSAVGVGGYAAYNKFSKEKGVEPELEIVEAEQKASTGDVYIPEFKKVFLSSESIEKDLTIYISDTEEADSCITGVPFQVKLLAPEAVEELQPYVTAIQDIDAQINEYTASYEAGTDITDILEDRNVAVTVTDENNEVVDSSTGDIETDPLYLLYLDKETAVQAYTVAVDGMEGVVYTDDDMDGVITETEVEPGDYVACIVNSLEDSVSYNTDSYETEVNVKDKVEYKVQTEIIKQVKKDNAAEDGQKVEATPVEATLTDTVPYVDSKKEETGSSYKETTDAVAPKSDAGKSTATKKEGKTSTEKNVTKTTSSRGTYRATENKTEEPASGSAGESGGSAGESGGSAGESGGSAGESGESGGSSGGSTTTPTQPETPKEYTITVKCVDESGADLGHGSTVKKKEGESYTITAPGIDGYTVTGNGTASGTMGSSNIDVKFTYKKNPQPKAKYNLTIYYKDQAGKDLLTAKVVPYEEGQTYSAKPETITGYTVVDGTEKTGTITQNVSVTFTYKQNTTTTKETASLDMSYSAGTFTVKASGNVSDVKINGTAVTMSNGSGTFKVTSNGDYKLTGTVTWSDTTKDTSLYVVYTVAGLTGGSDEELKDSKGNQLYLDAEGKKEAMASDYQKGKTYYVKQAAYKYYGWQTIDGKTKYFNSNGEYVTGEQVIQGVKYNFGSDGALLVNGVGIDVSKHQGSIDWAQAGPAVSFAIVRCGYRGMYDGQLHEDPYFYKNMSGAKANGVSTGIYIYSTALNEAEAVAEASMAVAMAKKAGGCSLPIYIDMEDSVRGQKSLSNEQRTAIINAFCSTVSSAGYKSGVYANKTWMTKYINTSSLPGSCYIWVAQYNTSCSYSGKYSMWQYSSKGSIPGIKGNVDVNKSYF